MDAARPYEPKDRAACLGLFDSNVPRFFDPSEKAGYAAFLDGLDSPYQVVERPDGLGGGRIVACGGLAVEPDGRTATLCWGMVEGGLHGRGVGTALTEARLAAARATPGVEVVRLDTGRWTTGFYERFGFVLERVTPDGYAPGSDRHDMRLDL